MNNFYTNDQQFDSINGIYKLFYTESQTAPGRLKRTAKVLLCKLLLLWQTLTGAAAKRAARVCAVTLSLVGIIGTAGAMETGGLSLPAGLTICILLLAVEFFCLRGGKR